ncbi:MAG: heparan-alpha-glucosaminide N-acetyltransferase domain-containing protein [Acidobacteriota bacterium]
MSTESVSSSHQHSERVLSIDVMRGCALIGMVLDHFQLYFGNDQAANTWPYFLMDHALGDWGAACFLMMMGMSQVLSTARRGFPDDSLLLRRAVIRSLYIFGIGLLMLALTWGPSQLWQWDILTLMGFATVVLYGCRSLRSRAILLSAAGLGLAAPILRGTTEFAAYWGGGLRNVPFISEYLPGAYVEPIAKYHVIWQVKPIVLGFLANGYFPLFPWLMFPLIGFVLGRRIVEGKARGDVLHLFVLGASLATAGLATAYAARGAPAAAVIGGFIAPLSFSPDSSSMVLFQTGMVLASYSFLFYFFDVLKIGNAAEGHFGRLLSLTSRFSLSFYFLHYLIIGWTLLAVYLVSGQYRISSLMNDIPALACGLAAIVALEVTLYLWQKTRGRYSLEWVLALLTAKVAPDDRK